MKIAGFDVGIKHLAFCIVTKEDGKLVDIGPWMNINLMGDEDKKKCSGLMKNKQQCSSIATCSGTINNETKYYCNKHKVSHVVNPDDIEKEHVVTYVPPNNKNVLKCTHNATCVKKAKYVVDGTYCCTQHKNNRVNVITKDMMLKPIKKITCNSLNPQMLCTIVYNELGKYECFKTVNEIRIENQPALTNPIMKNVSSTIFSYFVFMSLSQNLNINVKYLSPTHKIKLDDNLVKFVTQKIDAHNLIKTQDCKCKLCKLSNNIKEKKFSYESTKLLSIMQTEKTLIDHNLVHHFTQICENKKLDDYCDAFLYANM